MSKKLLLGIFTALSIMLLAGCGGGDSAEFTPSNGTAIAKCGDGNTTVTQSQTIELDADTQYILSHNQDGTKTICITDGSGTIY